MDADSYAKSLHDNDPSMTALQVGTKVKAQYPTTRKDEMVTALSYAGFGNAETHSAVEALYGDSSQYVVVAREKWQGTSINVDPEQPATVSFASGKWTANPSTGMVDAEGNSTYVAKPGYTLPGAHEGALIGWIGKAGSKTGEVISSYQPFLIGNGGQTPSGQTGELFLCINDDLNQEYGAGFDDNSGEVIVNIHVKKTASVS